MRSHPIEDITTQTPTENSPAVEIAAKREQFFHDLQDEIAETTLHPAAHISKVIHRMRPLVQEYILETHSPPKVVAASAEYYDSMRTAEEALRRPILRGLGYSAITPLMLRTLENIEERQQRHTQNGEVVFRAEAGRGRVHTGARGEFAKHADARLRSIASTAFCMMEFEKERDLFHTFWDISQRVRGFSGLALDHKLGEGWRTIDPAAISLVQVDELNGRKLKKNDRHLLIKTQKPRDIYQSFANAMATTAEFTAIGIEAMHRALAEAGCYRIDWYAYSFAHLNKLSFGARLPFWAAQDFAIEANQPYPSPLFTVNPHWPSRYHIEYARSNHKNYASKGITGLCQGIFLPPPEYIREHEAPLREKFIAGIGRAAIASDFIAWRDIPTTQEITSVDAATAFALSIAYRGQYNL